MRRTLFALAPVSLGLALSPPAEAAPRPTWGGAGYMMQGWAMGDLTGVGDTFGLDQPPGFGLTMGGGGFALLGGRVVLSGHGYGLLGLDGAGVAASGDLTGGGGDVTAGWAVVNDGRMLMFPSVGIAALGTDLVVENGADPATIGGADLVAGERRHYDGGGLSVTLSASMFQLFWGPTGDDGGGLVVGGSFGGWIPVSDAEPTRQGDGTGAPAGFFFRLHLGGGGATRG